MRFRLTLLVGMAVGYVLGTKAGRERYDQIQDMWRQFLSSETGQQVTSLADQAKETVKAKTSQGVSQATDSLSSQSSQSSDSSTSPSSSPSPSTGSTSPSTSSMPGSPTTSF